jgi:hypothetical protein
LAVFLAQLPRALLEAALLSWYLLHVGVLIVMCIVEDLIIVFIPKLVGILREKRVSRPVLFGLFLLSCTLVVGIVLLLRRVRVQE